MLSKVARRFPGGTLGLVAAVAAVAGGVWYYRAKHVKVGDVVGVDLSKVFPDQKLVAGEVSVKVLSVGPGDYLGVVYQPGSGGLVPPPALMGQITVPRSSVTRIISRA